MILILLSKHPYKLNCKQNWR